MTREEAVRLMAVYEAASAALGPVLHSRCVADETEREQVHLAHGRVIWTIFEECMKPVIRQYPDLDPDDIKPFLPKA